MTRHRSLPLAAALTAALLTTALPTASAADEPAVTGFALGSASDRLVGREAHALTTLTVAGVSITADGRRVLRPDAGTRRLAGTAERRGLRGELIVSNYSNRLGAFDRRAASRLLGSRANIERVARRLAGFVAAQGWDGVNVDLELVPRHRAGGLVRLVRRLQALMPEEKSVSIDVSASTSLAAYRAHGYRLAALADAADVIVLMAYDYHGPTWSGPGPIGPLRWQRQAIRAARQAVPAGQLDLGVAGYGYTWPRRGTGRTVTVAGARRLVRKDGARAVWHPAYGEWSARLSDGTVLWWSDRRSWRLRARLADDLDLHGLALWRLGSADPLP
ncbi:glycosyl hydrolase family 18 protein [Nocardioides sp. cx-173]|uniref:glycosyl hydrolase family 18 protein n=1 Tax=Nocardioides sp. cx-173 TaxID=2898796 RepID=UPI001E4F001F|nr:glycosyl hydrolase family 18 protein [Nocardioides sp. cx-173]MCD4525990.1 glycosyl hydrolase family 18 protein [Nocardioides sp. cx-173]UGB43686.1 glycosyl hydrolase family 18 protein [Nocardioides sp. cx-173]